MAQIRKMLAEIDLQTFADGAAAAAGGNAGASGATSTAAASNTGDTGFSAAKTGSNAQTASTSGGENGAQVSAAQGENAAQKAEKSPDERFNELINGEFKDAYKKNVEAIVKARVKNERENADRLSQLEPVLSMLSHKYGVDAKDAKALADAISDDDAFYEQEAIEKGVSVEQIKAFRKMERENSALREQMRQRDVQDRAEQLYASWMQQADEAKQVYPSLDLRTELQNERFVSLIKNNIDVRTAYEVVHRNEIMNAVRQTTAQDVQSMIAQSIATGAQRPNENGLSQKPASQVKTDVSKLSNKEIDDILAAVRRGERRSF